MSGAPVGRDAQSGHGGLYCVAWKSGREAATYRRPYPHATPYSTIRDIAEGLCAAQRRAELYPFRSATPTTGISTDVHTPPSQKCTEVCQDGTRRDSGAGKGHSHSLSRSAFREIHAENRRPTASSRPVCGDTMRETLSENAMLYPLETPRCGFELCASVLSAELAGGPGCAMVGGCVSTRFGPAPRPKPPAPVRRRQRAQERLFGEAVGKAQRTRRRVGGAP